MLSNDEIIAIFKENNALLEGHFLLSSGRHSQFYMQCALVLKNPKAAEQLCKVLADKLKDEKIDVVIGPAMGGIVVAYELGRALGVNALFSERVDGKMTLRRGFSLEKGQRVLIVEDVVTTGKSAKEVFPLVEECGAVVAGVACLVQRSKEVDFGVKLTNLIDLDFPTYAADECPLCEKGIEVVKPGSRNIK